MHALSFWSIFCAFNVYGKTRSRTTCDKPFHSCNLWSYMFFEISWSITWGHITTEFLFLQKNNCQSSTVLWFILYLQAISYSERFVHFNPLNPELNPICYLLALLAQHFLHVSRIRVKSLTLRLLMSYMCIYIYIYIYIYMTLVA